MPNEEFDGELTETERDIVEGMAVTYREGADIETIEELVTDPDWIRGWAEESDHSDLSPEEKIARQVLQTRKLDDPAAAAPLLHLGHMKKLIDSGVEILRDEAVYYRYEACVECIFELNAGQLEDAYGFVMDFETSDHGNALAQYQNEVINHMSSLQEVSPVSKGVPELFDTYADIAAFYERGFPILLALKRILDGDSPENEILQRVSSSAVRHELTADDEMNNVFFDLIVEQFDTTLRNGIAHGDTINDSVEQEIRIPTTRVTYSYEELKEVIFVNYLNVLFMTGMLPSLIKWRFHTIESDDITRDQLAV
ncbi:hypothetical protein [Salinarchaeum laminariae]|uniref:hypothetical protein n=1 Tax=Salinarchaeum laminariae TaxID=869888 RepID=UPI0020BEE4F6|nr:hypothetical protein [Salinarchaeum laminariae]